MGQKEGTFKTGHSELSRSTVDTSASFHSKPPPEWWQLHSFLPSLAYLPLLLSFARAALLQYLCVATFKIKEIFRHKFPTLWRTISIKLNFPTNCPAPHRPILPWQQQHGYSVYCLPFLGLKRRKRMHDQERKWRSFKENYSIVSTT